MLTVRNRSHAVFIEVSHDRDADRRRREGLVEREQ
jgi:hypothetical protein